MSLWSTRSPPTPRSRDPERAPPAGLCRIAPSFRGAFQGRRGRPRAVTGSQIVRRECVAGPHVARLVAGREPARALR